MTLFKNINEATRQAWLEKTLTSLPKGLCLLDAGAGELKNYKYCKHLNYVSQDFCQYHGMQGEHPDEGLQSKSWDNSRIDLISDITEIPKEDHSFDVILCSEVLEHVPEPTHALNEFTRLIKPGGILIITAPFASNVHMAPFHFSTGFSKYWYEHHLTLRGFKIQELVANGDWYALLRQEITRLGGIERQYGNWTWPVAYLYSMLGAIYFTLHTKKTAEDLACFGWHCIAVKN